MSDYIILTDSGCDIKESELAEWGVRRLDLTFKNVESSEDCTDRDVSVKEFYDMMRGGVVFQTSAANPDYLAQVFEREVSEGRDVLYICFSSGLSGTFGSAQLAAGEVEAKYPGRRVIVIDSLCASAGHGLLVYLAKERRDAGAGLDELAAYVSETVPKVCHWFTVDDLVYLKRGGRVSAAACFAATVLGIKPVLHVDDDGHLINMSKVRGRRLALKAMADKYLQTAIDPKSGIYFISHGDCIEDAERLENMIAAAVGHKAAHISDIGPVIGAHSGPGTLALFFLGTQR